MNRTPAQLEAITRHDGDLCVVAGAGSGKTSVLVERILHLLEKRLATVDEVVAITFTEKAAAEMKERLRQACREKAPSDDPDEQTYWRKVERRVDTARISTIHSFCMGLLKEHALSLGQDPDFGILTEPESFLLREEVVEETLHRLLESGDAGAFRLATEFRRADLFGMLRALLGDRSLFERVRAAHVPADPAELRNAWHRAVEARQQALFDRLLSSSDFKSHYDRLMSLAGCCADSSDLREQLRCSLLTEMDRARESGSLEVVADALARIAALSARGGSKKKWSSEDAFESVKDALNAIKKAAEKAVIARIAQELESESAQLTCDLVAVYGETLTALDAAKKRRNAYDFEDLISRTAQMLADGSRGEDSVCVRVARSIKFLLIDEFQDTDSVQLGIARALTDVAGGPQLFIVGDAKQSIYYFRGAEVEVFEQARRRADGEIPMTKNFRTLPDVLRFVNAFFAKTELLQAVENPYVPMEWHRDATGECRVEFLIPEEVDKAHASDYRDAEAELLANRILHLCAGESPVQVHDKRRDVMRPAVFGDVAILLRSFSDVHRYETALRKAAVPYTVVAGVGFYERQEIVDLRNLLTILVDPWNEMALLAVLRSPVIALSDEAIVEMRGGVSGGTGLAKGFYGKTVCSDPEQDGLLKRGRLLIDGLHALRGLPLTELVHRVLDKTEFEAILLGQFLGVQRASNLRKVADLAASFAQSQSPTLAAFVRYLNEVASPAIREGEAAIETEDNRTVTIMTVHKSKGLEFPIVAVADMGRGVQPGVKLPLAYHRSLGAALKVSNAEGNKAAPGVFQAVQSLRAEEELAEQARVLYVAMTRARDFLLLGGPPDAARDNQWMAAFNGAYGVCDLAHGGEFSGEGWRARVVRRVEPAGAVLESDEREPVPALEVLSARIAPVTASESPGLALAVTRLLHAVDERDDEAPPIGTLRFQAQGVTAALRGTLVHRFLELWDFASPPDALIDAMLLSECPTRSVRHTMGEELREVAARIAASDLGRQLTSATSLCKEVPFALRLGEDIVRGTIDAILDDSVIIDYKTGQWTEEKHARYEQQVRLYAFAVHEILGVQPRSAYLCYLDQPGEHWVREVDVSGPLHRQSIAEAIARLNEENMAGLGETP